MNKQRNKKQAKAVVIWHSWPSELWFLSLQMVEFNVKPWCAQTWLDFFRVYRHFRFSWVWKSIYRMGLPFSYLLAELQDWDRLWRSCLWFPAPYPTSLACPLLWGLNREEQNTSLWLEAFISYSSIMLAFLKVTGTHLERTRWTRPVPILQGSQSSGNKGSINNGTY